MFFFSNGTVELVVEPSYGCKIKDLLANFDHNFQCSITGTTFYSNQLPTGGAVQLFEHTYELKVAKNQIMSVIDQIKASRSPATAIVTKKLITECNAFLQPVLN